MVFRAKSPYTDEFQTKCIKSLYLSDFNLDLRSLLMSFLIAIANEENEMKLFFYTEYLYNKIGLLLQKGEHIDLMIPFRECPSMPLVGKL